MVKKVNNPDPFAIAIHRDQAVNVAGLRQPSPGEVCCLARDMLAVEIQIPIPQWFPELTIGAPSLVRSRA
jgi:hypothetical protein